MKFKDIKVKYKKSLTALLLTIAIILIILSLQGFKYKSFLTEYKSYFNDNKFNTASNYLSENCNFNLFREILLENNLSNYFREKLEEVNKGLESKTLNSDDAFIIANEINKYNLAKTEVTDTLSVISNNISDNSILTKGISEFEKGNFKEAIETLSSIPKDDLSYSTSTNYIDKSMSSLKESILKEASNLSKNDYYTKAITLLENNLDVLKNDKDVLNKIDELKKQKDEYLNTTTKKEPSAQTSNIITSISTSNINSLWVESLTPYLIFVDQPSQKTYIYNGKVNDWSLEKEMPCSTGIKGRETPSGVFDIREKGNWFFSEKYGQGGKYYTQFKGDYLFHSLPYGKDAKTVVDYTLGTPASHGCIRLNLDDAKWIFDNIPKGTKVIIN
ncbi:L,D-transpeptidase [Clostridium chrysemydis]|uniref:L,D-transpeptidase n=1 Tax=Clostridium chrysemydis TaxID=2665504 RepID=UPI003F3D64F2